MTRFIVALTVAAAAAAPGLGHFVFVVPDAKEPAKVVVVFSEDLDPDDHVAAAKLAPLKLFVRDAAGKDMSITHTPGENAVHAAVPGSGRRVVYGRLDYGVLQKGDAKPYLLAYHPKALVGGVPADKAALGEKAVPVEFVPVVAGGEVRFSSSRATSRWPAPR